MATEVSKIVDPDQGAGHDYDSWALYEAGEQGDLTGVRDEIAVAKCRSTGGTADNNTGSFVIDGWETSATQYIRFENDNSGGYDYVFQTDLEPTGCPGINENFVRFIDIKFVATADNSATYCMIYGGTGGLYVLQCTFQGYGTSYCNAIFTDTNQTAAYNFFINNVFYNWNTCLYTRPQSSSGRAIIYNNTFYGSYYGIRGRGPNNVVKNNLAFGCTDCYYEQEAFEVALNNAFDEGSDPGSDGLDISSYADNEIVTNAASNNFSLVSGSPVIAQALNLYADSYYAFQADIDGDDRGGSGADWDIGAYEYVAGGGSSIPVFMRSYRARRQ